MLFFYFLKLIAAYYSTYIIKIIIAPQKDASQKSTETNSKTAAEAKVSLIWTQVQQWRNHIQSTEGQKL